jgi:hypothetical protein
MNPKLKNIQFFSKKIEDFDVESKSCWRFDHVNIYTKNQKLKNKLKSKLKDKNQKLKKSENQKIHRLIRLIFWYPTLQSLGNICIMASRRNSS